VKASGSIFRGKERLASLIAGGAYLTISLVLSRMGLFNYLGYEFSAAIALVVPWIAGFHAMAVLRNRLTAPGEARGAEYLQGIREAVLQELLLLLLPFLVESANALFIKNCSYMEGLFFYLLIPVLTVIWSVMLAAVCHASFRHPRTVYVLLVIGVLCAPLYTGYTRPQIYSYNFIYGFFPGFSYDEVLSITPTLLLARALTLLGAAFFYTASIIAERAGLRSRSVLGKLSCLRDFLRPERVHLKVMSLGLLLLLGWMFRVPLGFETSTEKLRQCLSEQYETDHFHIYYAPGSFGEDDIRWVAAMHEFRYRQVVRALQENFQGKITSYIYPDEETKRRLLGTATTDISKPWLREIHISRDSWQATLKHELVHIVAGDFGMPVIRAHYNIGIVEGLATAVDGMYGNRTLNEYARAITKFGIVQDPGRLIKPAGFAAGFSSASYCLMGSFCEFLIGHYGIIRFKDLYGGKSEVRVYGKTYDALIEEWQGSLERVEVPPEWERHVRYYFDRPSIFAKECARAVARMNEEGTHFLRGNDPARAMMLFSEALATSWNTESYSGVIQSAYGAALYDSVVALVRARPEGSLSLLLLYGDALWDRGDTAGARAAYQEMLVLDLSDRADEAASLRSAAIREPQLREFFLGKVPDSTALEQLDSLAKGSPSPVLAFLRARYLMARRAYGGVVEALEPAAAVQGSPALDAGREQMLGQAHFYRKEFQQSRVHFWLSLNYIRNNASVARVNDWLDRCEWFGRNAERMLR
jgi:hypothetical protein